MKNELQQVMGVTPFMGDTRPRNKGGRKTEKTLTGLVKVAERAAQDAQEAAAAARREWLAAREGNARVYVELERMRRRLVRWALWLVLAFLLLVVGLGWGLLSRLLE